MSDSGRPIATPSQTVGPFFHYGLTTDQSLGRIAAGDGNGARIRLRVRVFDGDGSPVPDALIEVYQASAAGRYPPPQSADPAFTGFGRLPTDAAGACVFDTVHPGPVDSPHGTQAPHILVCLLARGLLRQVYTRMYFEGDGGHDADPFLRLVPGDRRRTLMASRASAGDETWEFVIHLQGERETVFFDI